ncbi:Aste57867_11877 [Aphanomyces stellatus]|uniref:Aste57867_11877 protein n=1 Tax=Aphanomyces stellatus TaxID=120398 RepID=A0A485KW40_9STRA|nr:hypothetical protein As57867_011832 [Aphanomyces stellatus]VFT88732.1 Aste57867_11877 [Aphanomyces stellatus]
MRLVDVTAVVTGAARGLGLAFARAILEGGGRVLMTDIDVDELEKNADTLSVEFPVDRVHWLPHDVSNLQSFAGVFDACAIAFPSHPVNVLVNNAGISSPIDNFYANDPADLSWTKIVEINLMGSIRGTQLALHRLDGTRGSPVVVNVSSLAGLMPSPSFPVYSATKFGLVGLTECTGAFFGDKTQVRVVALCPRETDTAMGRYYKANAPPSLCGELMSTAYVAQGLIKCIQDDNNAGKSYVVTQDICAYHQEMPKP